MPEPLPPGSIPQKRPLRSAEIDLIRWLLQHSKPEHHHFAEQIPSLTVASKCPCGCPTIDFAVNGTAVDRKGEQIISDFLGSIGQEPVGVMLFETNGKLSTLEAYSDFPDTSTLLPY